jgi:CHAD domain-containing protein
MTSGKHMARPVTPELDMSGRNLSAALKERWAAYRKVRKRCRQAAKEDAVHELRIEIRRTLATLVLLAPLLPRGITRQISDALRQELKALSRLRDTHVHLNAMAIHLAAFPGVRVLLEAMREREGRWTRKIRRRLRCTGLGRQTREVKNLLRVLIRERSTESMARTLSANLQQAFDYLTVCQRKVDLKQIETIHCTRVAFKNYRYMVEAADRIRPLINARQRETLRRYQARMGEIQDADTLLARAEKFRRKKSGASLAGYCQHLLNQRDGLVRRFALTRMDLQGIAPRKLKWKTS